MKACCSPFMKAVLANSRNHAEVRRIMIEAGFGKENAVQARFVLHEKNGEPEKPVTVVAYKVPTHPHT